jgi:hypothetical protein
VFDANCVFCKVKTNQCDFLRIFKVVGCLLFMTWDAIKASRILPQYVTVCGSGVVISDHPVLSRSRRERERERVPYLMERNESAFQNICMHILYVCSYDEKRDDLHTYAENY